VRKDTNDNTDLFKSDATFCAQPGLNGSNVSLVAYALAGKYIRHMNAQVWVGAASGTDPGDGGGSGFSADATWLVANGLSTGGGGGSWPNLPARSDGKWVRVKNGSSFPIWVHAANPPDLGNIILTPDDVQLASGAHQDYLAPNQWPGARVTAYGNGPRSGELDKAELTINPTLNYNVTYVDWVGLPLEVVGVGGNCTAAAHTTACYAKQSVITSGCPESFLLQGKQCISPRSYCANGANQGNAYCHALDSAIANCASCPKDTTTNVYMCAGLYQENPRLCAALNRGMSTDIDNYNSAAYYQKPPYNTYAKWVHQMCPNIYAFSYDDWQGTESGFRSCGGDEVRITFCPNG
jgi:hypothetical protein